MLIWGDAEGGGGGWGEGQGICETKQSHETKRTHNGGSKLPPRQHSAAAAERAGQHGVVLCVIRVVSVGA